jgi:hypothetical protein
MVFYTVISVVGRVDSSLKEMGVGILIPFGLRIISWDGLPKFGATPNVSIVGPREMPDLNGYGLNGIEPMGDYGICFGL